jgi:hypothetical protein
MLSGLLEADRGSGQGLIFFYERKTTMPKKTGYGNGKKPPKK